MPTITTPSLSFASGWWGLGRGVVYTFSGTSWPMGALTVDAKGVLYGVTPCGGAKKLGTVFRLTHHKTGWVLLTIHTFKTPYMKTGMDGNVPLSGVIVDQQGNVYGGTYTGGMYNDGMAYMLLKIRANAYVEAVLCYFNFADGDGPAANLVLDGLGNVYGTTSGGGIDWGTVFEITTGK